MMRAFYLSAGLLTLAAAWVGPLPQLARQAFFAHMTMHMAVVTVAGPLIAFAVAGSRFDPVRRVPVFFAPVQASIVELVVVWAWHAPALHHAARHTGGWMAAEQSTFFLSAFVVWLSAFGGETGVEGCRRGAGVVALLLTSMHMTLLGALLALSGRPLYIHVEGLAGLSPIEDQHLGGAIMLVAGGLAYLVGGLRLTIEMLREPAAPVREDAS
jgi:putative membrane protein